MSEIAPPPRFLRGPGRPLLDALGSWLLSRLCREIPRIRTQVSAIHAEITRTAPARLPAFAGVLERLVAEDAPALAFAEQLAVGWRHYAVPVSERRLARPPEAKRWSARKSCGGCGRAGSAAARHRRRRRGTSS